MGWKGPQGGHAQDWPIPDTSIQMVLRHEASAEAEGEESRA